MKQVRAFTDGACSGNPGPGGWGAVLQFGDKTQIAMPISQPIQSCYTLIVSRHVES